MVVLESVLNGPSMILEKQVDNNISHSLYMLKACNKLKNERVLVDQIEYMKTDNDKV